MEQELHTVTGDITLLSSFAKANDANRYIFMSEEELENEGIEQKPLRYLSPHYAAIRYDLVYNEEFLLVGALTHFFENAQNSYEAAEDTDYITQVSVHGDYPNKGIATHLLRRRLCESYQKNNVLALSEFTTQGMERISKTVSKMHNQDFPDLWILYREIGYRTKGHRPYKINDSEFGYATLDYL